MRAPRCGDGASAGKACNASRSGAGLEDACDGPREAKEGMICWHGRPIITAGRQRPSVGAAAYSPLPNLAMITMMAICSTPWKPTP